MPNPGQPLVGLQRRAAPGTRSRTASSTYPSDLPLECVPSTAPRKSRRDDPPRDLPLRPHLARGCAVRPRRTARRGPGGRLAVSAAAEPASLPTTASLSYPPTRTVDVVDDYFGRKVADPYRWLEDLDSPDTSAWVVAQNKLTFGYLEALPGRDAITKRLTELWDYQRTGIPVFEAGQLWFSQNSGLQRQSPVFRQSGFEATPTLVIDPNVLSPDGSVAMAQWSPSPDGRYLAYTRAAGGSDVEDIYVRNLETGKDLAGVVMHVKFGEIHWTHDSRGFFYSRFKGTETAADFAEANRVPPGLVPQSRRHDTGSPRLRPSGPPRGRDRRSSQRRRPMALPDRRERHDEQPALGNRPGIRDETRHRREAEALGTRRGRDTPAAGSRRRDRVPLHDVPGAQGPHRRGRHRRQRPVEVAHRRGGSEGSDRRRGRAARRRSNRGHVPRGRAEPRAPVRAGWHRQGRDPPPGSRLRDGTRRPQRRPGAVPGVHLVPAPIHGLSLRPGERGDAALPSTQVAVRCQPVRDPRAFL